MSKAQSEPNADRREGRMGTTIGVIALVLCCLALAIFSVKQTLDRDKPVSGGSMPATPDWAWMAEGPEKDKARQDWLDAGGSPTEASAADGPPGGDDGPPPDVR